MSRVVSYNLDYNLNVQTGVDKTYFPIRGWTDFNDSEDTMQKYGFKYDRKTQRFTFRYPAEFIAPSEHDKYIIFQYCRCSVNGSIHGETEVHASFIPRDNYCDSLVYYANLQVPDDNRKYKVNTNRNITFDVWFTKSKGEMYTDKEGKILPGNDDRHKLNFVMFLKLMY